MSRRPTDIRAFLYLLQCGLSALSFGEVLSQGIYSRIPEHIHDRNLPLKGRARLADNPNQKQRITAEIKEVVIDADLSNLERLSPDRSQRLFGFGLRGDKNL